MDVALNPDMTIWAVEPENAAILAGGTVGSHLQMGIGDGVIPEILNQNIYEDIYIVTDEEAIQTATASWRIRSDAAASSRFFISASIAARSLSSSDMAGALPPQMSAMSLSYVSSVYIWLLRSS